MTPETPKDNTLVVVPVSQLCPWCPQISFIKQKNAPPAGGAGDRKSKIFRVFPPAIPDRKAVYSANTGIRIHGYSSSALPQKSFKLYSRAEYGTKKFDYDLFHGAVKNVNGEHIGSFNHLILRNGGNDQKLKLRDRLNQEMAAGGSFGTQAQTECIVFLDGEYWGLYNITEKLNESYVTAHYGVKKSTVCMFKDPVEYIEGDVKGLEDYKEKVRSMQESICSRICRRSSVQAM